MKRIVVIPLVLVVVLLAASTVASGTARAPSPTEQAAAAKRMWLANLRRGASADPTKHFSNPSWATLNARLRRAAARYHFTVIETTIYHPRQQAPFVVVEARNEHVLAVATGAILHLIDPKARTNDDRTGWAYEGFMFEARDSHGVPFLATFNWWRGPHAGGGQWAIKQSLLPAPHG